MQWADGSKINLLGRITGVGTAPERIRFLYANACPNRIEVSGTLDLIFTDINVVLNINAGGSLRREPVTRSLNELQNRQLIAQHRGHIALLDVENWKKSARIKAFEKKI